MTEILVVVEEKHMQNDSLLKMTVQQYMSMLIMLTID
jgi:hypothetical protein